MNKVKSTTIALVTATACLTGASFSSLAMDPFIETALVDVCKATLSDSILEYKKTAKEYHLKDKAIALKVMCNGADIIDFAESHGAYKTAAKLQRSIGEVSITDVAAATKINVNFTE